jgi:hypothetical protein
MNITKTDLNGNSVTTATPAASKDLTAADFVKHGYTIDPDGVDAALKDMPSLVVLLNQYQAVAGLSREDAETPGSALHSALARMVSKGHFTAQQSADFVSTWPES